MLIYSGETLQKYMEEKIISDQMTVPAKQLLEELTREPKGVWILKGYKGCGKRTAILQAIKEIGDYEHIMYVGAGGKKMDDVIQYIIEHEPFQYVFVDDATGIEGFYQRACVLEALCYHEGSCEISENPCSPLKDKLDQYQKVFGGAKVIINGDETLLLEWWKNREFVYPQRIHEIKFKRLKYAETKAFFEKEDLSLQEFFATDGSGDNTEHTLRAFDFMDETIVNNIVDSYEKYRPMQDRSAFSLMDKREMQSFITYHLFGLMKRDLLYLMQTHDNWVYPLIAVCSKERMKTLQSELMYFLQEETTIADEDYDAWVELMEIFQVIGVVKKAKDNHDIFADPAFRFWLGVDVIDRFFLSYYRSKLSDAEEEVVRAAMQRLIVDAMEVDYDCPEE